MIPLMRGWNDYYFMVGSAAAALIGLMFVVVTLTAGRDRQELEAGKKLYTTPIVWHLGVVLVLSGGAIAPLNDPHLLAFGSLAAGALGIAYACYITAGIVRARLASGFSGYDAFWYGIAPGLIYGTVIVSGWALLDEARSGPSLLAASSLGLLLISIHNEWDLVTYLAPEATSTANSGRKDAP